MDLSQILKNIPASNTVIFLYQGFVNFHPQFFFKAEELQEHQTKTPWFTLTTDQFDSFLLNITSQSDLETASYVVKKWYEELGKQGEVHVLQAQEVEEQVKEIKQPTRQKIYLKVKQEKPVTLSTQEQEALAKFQEAAKASPIEFAGQIEKVIAENYQKSRENPNLPLEEAVRTNIKIIAADATQRFLGNEIVGASPAILASVAANPNTPKVLAQQAADLAALQQFDLDTIKSTLYPVFGEKLVESLYSDSRTFEVSETPTNISINTEEITKTHLALQQTEFFKQAVVSPASDKPVDLEKNLKIDLQIQNLHVQALETLTRSLGSSDAVSRTFSARNFALGQEFIKASVTQVSTDITTQITSTSFSGIARPLLTPVVNVLAKATGINSIGLSLAAKTQPILSALRSTSLGAKTATLASGALKALGLITKAIPGIGMVASFIGGWLAPKLLSFFKINFNKLLNISGGLAFLGGILTGNGLLVGAGGLALVAGATVTAGGVLAGLGLAVGSFFALVGALTAAFLAAIAVPLALTMIGLMIAIPLILFIINSGAYLVPPAPSIGLSGDASGALVNIESEYMRVTKTAVPAGPFKNSDADVGTIQIEYLIKIEAKKGSLENFEFKNECKVIRGQSSTSDTVRGVTPTCVGMIPEADKMPGVITPANPYTYNYSQIYKGSDFHDSFVVDSFEVRADAVGFKEDDLAIGSAGIVIGNPPRDCPSIWPVATNGGQTYHVAQGPGGNTSHGPSVVYPEGANWPFVQAIDISPLGGYDPNRNIIVAGHNGTAIAYSNGATGPFGVAIKGVCNGQEFLSMYAHMAESFVNDGDVVIAGQQIGKMGCLGRCRGPHLHYEFTGPRFQSKGPNAAPPIMRTPYIPKSVPYYCVGNCGVTIP